MTQPVKNLRLPSVVMRLARMGAFFPLGSVFPGPFYAVFVNRVRLLFALFGP